MNIKVWDIAIVIFLKKGNLTKLSAQGNYNVFCQNISINCKSNFYYYWACNAMCIYIINT